MQASRPVDVTVMADGAAAFSGKLDADQSKQVEARDTIEISSGDPEALTLSLNGQPVHAPAAAGPNAKVTLTRSDLQPAAEAAH